MLKSLTFSKIFQIKNILEKKENNALPYLKPIVVVFANLNN